MMSTFFKLHIPAEMKHFRQEFDKYVSITFIKFKKCEPLQQEKLFQLSINAKSGIWIVVDTGHLSPFAL